jgi:hypothetical protein
MDRFGFSLLTAGFIVRSSTLYFVTIILVASGFPHILVGNPFLMSKLGGFFTGFSHWCLYY